MLEHNERKQLADQLYEQHGKPLEQEHLGEYVAISRDGETVLGESLLEVATKASRVIGRGHFLFKIGDKAVGRLR